MLYVCCSSHNKLLLLNISSQQNNHKSLKTSTKLEVRPVSNAVLHMS